MKKYISIAILIISVSTIISGLLQIVAPGFVLRFIGAQVSLPLAHLFATIGLFMAIFGGMMIHALYSSAGNQAAILWSSFQKFGACLAVVAGILHGVFSIVAGTVAAFDLLSGILFIYYYNLRKRS